MNKALIAKVGWRLLQDQSSLWAEVLRKKYKIGDLRDCQWLRKKGTWSSTWRSIVTGLVDVISRGTCWVPGDGHHIRFWRDIWVSGKPLWEDGQGVVPANLETESVRSLWKDDSGWDISRISPYVSESRCLELRAIVSDHVTGARDRISWNESQNGQFSVSSAYNMLSWDDSPRPNMEKFFNRIWRVKVPERVRAFFWLVVNQGIMTDAERYRRHIGESEICQICKGGVETTLHILRDCPAMSGIWTRIVPQRKRRAFFDKTLFEWVFDNLHEETPFQESSWSTVFAMAVWWGWKWRCGNIFGEKRKCRDRVQFIKDVAKEVFVANARATVLNGIPTRVERQIGWVAQSTGWYKVNTDGASRGNPGLATAGGVIRDGAGNWCGGFALNIGRCSAPLAELWGVYYGFYLAWTKALTRVELEVDSELVVGFLKTGIGDQHPLSFLVRLCHGLLSKDWIVRITHVYREANRLADGLANYAFSLPLGFHSLIDVPDDLEVILHEDSLGSTRPRRVRL